MALWTHFSVVPIKFMVHCTNRQIFHFSKWPFIKKLHPKTEINRKRRVICSTNVILSNQISYLMIFSIEIIEKIHTYPPQCLYTISYERPFRPSHYCIRRTENPLEADCLLSMLNRLFNFIPLGSVTLQLTTGFTFIASVGRFKIQSTVRPIFFSLRISRGLQMRQFVVYYDVYKTLYLCQLCLRNKRWLIIGSQVINPQTPVSTILYPATFQIIIFHLKISEYKIIIANLLFNFN